MAKEPVVAEEVAEDGAEAKSKSAKKKLIIIAVVALLLVGGGVAAWLLMGSKPAEGEEQAKSEKSQTVKSSEPIFVKLDTFTVNLNPEEGEKYLQVDITLNASDANDVTEIEKRMPQVRNRVLMILTSKLASEIAGMEGKQALGAEITEQINEPYSEGAEPLKITEAFFTSFVIQ